jgi:hypothetical protein
VGGGRAIWGGDLSRNFSGALAERPEDVTRDELVLRNGSVLDCFTLG